MLIEVLAQAEEDGGLILPDTGGAAVVFAILVAIGAGLWFLIRRTRRRAESEYWERKHRERDRDPD